MDIFVRTRGLKLEQDYEWVKVEGNRQSIDKPYLQINKSPGTIEIDDLIDTKDFSLAIVRNQKEIILYVTGLSSQFKDPYNTSIRNSICWVLNDSEEESIIRGLAVKFLKQKEEIESEIQECITRQSDGTVLIDTKKIRRISQEVDTSFLGKNKITGNLKQTKIDRNTHNNQIFLAKTLTENILPIHQSVLVIVTTKVSDTKLRGADVWRGLTNILEKYGISRNNQPHIQVPIKPPWYNIRVVTPIVLVAILIIAPVVIRAIIPPEEKQPLLQISYIDSNLNLQVNLKNSNIKKLYYRGGFSENKTAPKLEGITIDNSNFSRTIERIDGPNPSKLNTTYKFIISDQQIEDEDVKELFKFSTDSPCLSQVEKIDKYPVNLCITTPISLK